MSLFFINILWITIAPSFYGLMYALSFMIGYYILKKGKKIFSYHLDDLFLYVFAWVILWGRIWYILFYNLSYYLSSPVEIFYFWNGGMSFHGGVVGVIIALLLFSKRKELNPYMLLDEIARVATIWLGLGRLGNYANKELLGFPYTGPLAVVTETGSFFPSPLLESFLEWLVLYFILNYFYKRKHTHWQIGSLFLIGYGVFRIFVEVFFRTPDTQIGYILPYVSMGSLLSFVMIVVWGVFYVRLSKKS